MGAFHNHQRTGCGYYCVIKRKAEMCNCSAEDMKVTNYIGHAWYSARLLEF